MKPSFALRTLAGLFAVVSGSLLLVQLSAAFDSNDVRTASMSERLRRPYETGELLLIVPAVTREPWRTFDPLAPTIGGEDREENEFEGNADARLEWFLSKRTFPYATLPANARRRAWEQRIEGSNRTATGLPVQWRPIGPRPTFSDFPNNWGQTSGRINSIAVSPADANLLLVGAATGGIWRSTDGGTSFAPVSDSQVDLAVGSIAFAPSDPQIVYAGMGDTAGYLGSGLLRSTDAGQTWVRVSNSTLPAPGTISRIAVDPTNPNRVYVAQYSALSGASVFSSGFFVSSDGGVSFSRTFVGLPRDLVRHPTDPNILYLSATRWDGGSPNTGGVWKSTNKGATWTRIHTSSFASTTNIKVAVTPAAPESVYVLSAGGGNAAVEVSTDGGTMWTPRGTSFDKGQIGYNCYLFVHPTDVSTIYVGTRDLWRTTDGGANYTNVTNNFSLTGSYSPTQSRSHPDQHHFYISPSNPDIFYLANDGGLSRTTNGGTSFTSLNGTLGLTMFVSLAVHPSASLRTYGGTQDNGSQRRINDTGWDEFISGDGGQINLDHLDPSIVYSTYVSHTVWRFNNNGSNFSATIGSTTTFNNDRVAFYPPFVGNAVDSTIYFGTYRLYASTNRGASWSPPGGTTDLTNGAGTLSAIAVSKSNINTIYTGANDGRVMVSVNGGTTWEQRTTGLPNRFIESITIDPTDPNIAYLTVSGFTTNHVFKTVNAGTTWTNMSGNLPDIPVNTLAMDPRPGNSGTFYVGTDIGVFRTIDGGTNWETFSNGMPPVIVTELVVQPNGLLQAGTYGRGAYEINLNGTRKQMFDYDADRKADISVRRPSDNVWHLLRATAGYTAMRFGEPGDRMTPADYDGDGKTDVSVFRPSNGTWHMFMSGTQTFEAFGWGQDGDLPVPTDRDNDGRTDLVIFRPSDNNWYTRYANGTFNITNFGVAGDKPVVGDFDGDGTGDIALFRPSNHNWYIIKSSLGFFIQTWGVPGDIPLTGDFDGDGATDQAVFRPSTGQWYLSQTTAGFAVSLWGVVGDIPVAADYDGDGRTDVAVYRPSEGNWYILNSTAGIQIQQFGEAGDVPTQTAFNY